MCVMVCLRSCIYVYLYILIRCNLKISWSLLRRVDFRVWKVSKDVKLGWRLVFFVEEFRGFVDGVGEFEVLV